MKDALYDLIFVEKYIVYLIVPILAGLVIYVGWLFLKRRLGSLKKNLVFWIWTIVWSVLVLFWIGIKVLLDVNHTDRHYYYDMTNSIVFYKFEENVLEYSYPKLNKVIIRGGDVSYEVIKVSDKANVTVDYCYYAGAAPVKVYLPVEGVLMLDDYALYNKCSDCRSSDQKKVEVKIYVPEECTFTEENVEIRRGR